LLAYLDDTLEPAQAKLIGQKVAESETAQELMARIKTVTRRRRLTSPPASGAGANTDPNTVAEYLDNALSADKLAEVEETCLASDVHLAEIAACHQILTLVLGEPALVPPTSRQRMYSLVKGPEAIPFRRPPRAYESPAPADDGQEADETLRMGLPAYRRQGGWGQALTMLAGGLALVALLAGAIWLAWPPSPKTDKGNRAALDRGPDDKNKTPSVVKNNGSKSPAKDKKNLDKPATDKGGGDKDQGNVKNGDKGDKDKGETDKGGKDRDDAGDKDKKSGGPADTIPNAEPRVVGRHVPPGVGEARTILVRQEKDSKEWERLERNHLEVKTGDTLVSLPGYRSTVRFFNGLKLQLWGDLPELSFFTPVLESTVVIHEPREFDLDLTLDRGRIVITNYKNKDARVRVRFANPYGKDGMDSWDVTLARSDGRGENKVSEVAVELWARYPADVPFNKNKKTRRGPKAQLFLFVFQGQASVKVDDSTFAMEEPPGPGLVFWDSDKGPSPPNSIKRLPDWVRRLPPFPPELGKDYTKYLDELRAKMVVALEELTASMSATKPVVALNQELKSDSWIKRSLIVRCFGALNDLSILMDGLRDPKYPEVRQSAIEALRHWIGLHTDNDLKLHAFLRQRQGYSGDEADIIMDLLHSFSDEAIAKPTTFARLVDYLRPDNKDTIRVLAHWHLIRLVRAGAKIKYDPMGDSNQLERGYEDWKKAILERNFPKKPMKP
jgi:hypothetical protein